jgi:hypothetical protein
VRRALEQPRAERAEEAAASPCGFCGRRPIRRVMTGHGATRQSRCPLNLQGRVEGGER